jgi:protein tyrosine phosphatase (PTP) superfamily phosphohydrolase (DUF442 family)
VSSITPFLSYDSPEVRAGFRREVDRKKVARRSNSWFDPAANQEFYSMIQLVVILLLASSTAFAQDSTAHAELPRFQQVNENLYRGGQPQPGGISKLRELGINTVINLRGASDRTRAEEAEVRAAGLNYFNVSLPNWGRPQNGRVARILELISKPENGRVFVHCKDGVDRTGMIVAMYRMTHDGWTSTQALAEAQHLGMRRTQVWMRDYAEDYGELVHKVGPETALKSPGVHEEFDDRVGTGMRFVERGAFTARKFARRFFRRLR